MESQELPLIAALQRRATLRTADPAIKGICGANFSSMRLVSSDVAGNPDWLGKAWRQWRL